MTSIFNGDASDELVNEKVLADTAGQDFKVEAITLVKLIDSYTCDVVVKDGQGYRSYLVSLEKDHKFDHDYRILDVQGQKLISNYQWEKMP